jgi:hypothetical protein
MFRVLRVTPVYIGVALAALASFGVATSLSTAWAKQPSAHQNRVGWGWGPCRLCNCPAFNLAPWNRLYCRIEGCDHTFYSHKDFQ